MTSRRSLSVEEILAVLPDQPEFDQFRQAVLRASAQDPDGTWSSLVPYSTLDQRTLPSNQIPQILAEAEAANRQRAKRLADGVHIALSGVIEGFVDAKAQVLLAAGEEDEKAERWRDAVAHYSMAAHLSRMSSDLQLRALAQRRLGRAWLHCGEFRQASIEYSASMATAAAAGSIKDEITATTGLGNVASFQGRWGDAARWYQNALQKCGPGFERERGQLCVNLSMTSRERAELLDARRWLNEAQAHWNNLTAADHSGWFNNDGLLLLALGNLEAAERSFTRALELALSHVDRIMIMDNLADVAARQDRLEVAETRAREAEEFAIKLGSPRILAEVYLRLGTLCRLRGDANGVVFFEKAVALSRDRGYPLLHATILREYALYRKAQRDARGATALFTDAVRIFSDLGAVELAGATRGQM